MLPDVKVTQTVVNRLKSVSENSQGKLFGYVNKNVQYIIGLFLSSEDDNAELHFPADVDMCGIFQTGDLRKDEIDKLLRFVDVTDTPVVISIPDPILILAYHSLSDQLVQSSLTVVPDVEIYREFLHMHVTAQIPFSAELENTAINEELIQIRKQFSSGRIAFHVEKYDVFLLGSNENTCGRMKVDSTTSLEEIFKTPSEISEVDYARGDIELHVVPVDMYKKATLETSEDTFHAPIIQMEKCETTFLNLFLNIDSIAMVHKSRSLGNLYTTLVEALCRNTSLFGKFIKDYIKKNEDTIEYSFQPEVIHYFPKPCGHFITRVKNRSDHDSKNYEERARANLHSKFMLPNNRPVFRKSNQFEFSMDTLKISNGELLENPHSSVKFTDNGGELSLVTGRYHYYHYCQDNMDDNGWGCAYRSLQTLASWFKLQGYINKDVPTFKEIQQCLYDIGDKPASFVGSRQWIGSTEVSFVLESLLQISSKILFINTGEEMADKGPELAYHFKTNGTPIMIGGGVLAHTILGVDYNRNTGDLKFLILDPHYTGKEDLKTIVSKGWCGWKGVKFWDKKAHYNMCLPQLPNCI